jgi:hypothetical protein
MIKNLRHINLTVPLKERNNLNTPRMQLAGGGGGVRVKKETSQILGSNDKPHKQPSTCSLSAQENKKYYLR